MTTTQTTNGETVLVLSNAPGKAGGGVIAGPAARLSAICAGLGFRDRCENGRLYLTGPKMARIGLGDAVGQLPNWHSLSTAELARISSEVA